MVKAMQDLSVHWRKMVKGEKYCQCLRFEVRLVLWTVGFTILTPGKKREQSAVLQNQIRESSFSERVLMIVVSASWLATLTGFGRPKFRFPLCLWRFVALHIGTLIVMHALAFSSFQLYSYSCLLVCSKQWESSARGNENGNALPSLPNPRQIYSLVLCKLCFVQRQETWTQIL